MDVETPRRPLPEAIPPAAARRPPSHAQELVHDLRNSLAAISFGMEILGRIRNDEKEFARTQAAITEQCARLKEQIGRAVSLLESIN